MQEKYIKLFLEIFYVKLISKYGLYLIDNQNICQIIYIKNIYNSINQKIFIPIIELIFSA